MTTQTHTTGQPTPMGGTTIDIFTNDAVIQILNKMTIKGVKMQEEHVNAHIRNTIEWAIDNATAERSNAYIASIQLQMWNGKRMSAKQIAGAANTFRYLYGEYLVQTARSEVKFVKRDQIPAGTYTITNGSKHVTIRLIDAPEGYGKEKGTQLAKYLYGPDNLRDYRFFAWIYPNREIAVKPTFKHSKSLVDALLVLMKADDEDYIKAGQAWAQKSNHCFICSRKLTDDISAFNGIGPICADNIGFDRLPPVKSVLDTGKPAPRVASDELFD